MYRKSHRYRKKGDEHPDKAKKRFYPFSIDFGVGHIITEKENDRANAETGQHIKIPAKRGIIIFDVQNGNT